MEAEKHVPRAPVQQRQWRIDFQRALDDVDFLEAQLKDVRFSNCTINNITFAQARMKNVDLSESTCEGIKGVNSLKGATISHEQLIQLSPYFATEAGIRVK